MSHWKHTSIGKRHSNGRFDIATKIGYFSCFRGINQHIIYTNGKRRFWGIIFILYVVPKDIFGCVVNIYFVRKFSGFKFTREPCWKQLIIGSFLTSCLFRYSIVNYSIVSEMNSLFLFVLYVEHRKYLQLADPVNFVPPNIKRIPCIHQNNFGL